MARPGILLASSEYIRKHSVSVVIETLQYSQPGHPWRHVLGGYSVYLGKVYIAGTLPEILDNLTTREFDALLRGLPSGPEPIR